MSSKLEKDKAKQLQDKCQSVLTELLRDEDNKYCVDCDSKGPRWASWNLGVFLCIRCAGIHRNLGVHISKVKSVNLDTWTPEQVVSLQQMGNSRARAVYEANLPDNFRRPQNDTSLETFIRAKYEHKKYIAREWVPPALPKVNWEKEIDEEIEKQKRKKKTIVEKKSSLGNVEVPQLPKPKNPSPKPGRAQAPPVAAENKPSTDLLGLQNGEDGFSNFLSAPTTTTITEDKKDSDKQQQDNMKNEEESFFNQTAPTEKEKIKLTKDSILALYGNTPVNNFNHPGGYSNVPPSFGTYPMQQGYQNFGVFPQQQSYNGMQQQQFPVQYGNAQAAQALQYQGHHQQQPVPVQFQGQTQFQQFQSLPSQFQYQHNSNNFTATQGAVPNPFFVGNQASSLQQQFGSLTLGGQPTANPAPSLSANIWQ